MGDKNKKKAVAVVQLNKWADDFCSPLAVETLKLLASKGDDGDDTVYLAVIGSYFKELVKWVVFRELTADVSKLNTNKQKEEFLRSKFFNLKLCLQEAIADGFSASTSKWSGKEIEYYAKISPVPDGNGGGKDGGQTFH